MTPQPAGEAPLGVVMLDHPLTRPPGDPGNPTTFPFPVAYRTVTGVSLERLLRRDPAIVDQLIEAGRELVAAGAWGVTTGCGFFVLFQSQAAAAIPAPVFLSSLLQIPLVQAQLGPDERVGVLTAHAGRLTPDHLAAAGMDPARPAVVVGLEDSPAFAGAILTPNGRYDRAAMETEIIDAARKLVESGPIGAIVLECTNLPPFAAAIQAAVDRPVYDITTLARSVRAARFRTPFPTE